MYKFLLCFKVIHQSHFICRTEPHSAPQKKNKENTNKYAKGMGTKEKSYTNTYPQSKIDSKTW